MDDKLKKVVDLLERIVHGNQRDKETASELNGAMLKCFPDADDDPRFEQLMYVLACYRPEGGQYLYDAAGLAEECERVLSLLKK